MVMARAEASRMFQHFATVAGVYRNMRTTDEAPILFIRDALRGRKSLRAADIGCGAGRYDCLLFRHIPGLHLTCIDASAEMLAQLEDLLAGEDIRDFETRVSGVEELALDAGSLDAVFSFNAVHHFSLPDFLATVRPALAPDGRIFIYTRTPEQNAGSVWGRHFPDFCDKETRLYTLAQMTAWVGEADGLRLIAAEAFEYPRSASLERLLEQAKNRHYSTFSLYGEAEFETACRGFADNVRRHFDDPARIDWQDANTLLHIGSGAGDST